MTKRQKKLTVFSLFFNYILQGMAAIILSSHLRELINQFNTSAKGVSLVISSIGLGRVLVLYLSGFLSDKWGRKPIIIIGMCSYILFFSGILISKNIYSAAFFALFAGVANAFLDTGTYPAIAEIYPEFSGSISVINKAFISIGQFILPYFISFLMIRDLYFGYSFILCLVLIVANLLIMSQCKFPVARITFTKENETMLKDSNSKIEGVALVVLGFTIVTLFNVICWWMPEVAIQTVGMKKAQAVKLISLYSFGSFISVFITAYISKKTKANHKILLFCSMMSLLTLLSIVFFPSVTMYRVGTFLIGAFAAGGIWQIALAIMIEFYPSYKGRVTSIYTMATSISVMVIPYLLGMIAELNIKGVVWFDVIIAIINLVAAVIVYKIYDERMNTFHKKVSV